MSGGGDFESAWESRAECIAEIQQSWPLYREAKHDGKPGPLDMCPESERGNVLMMMMAGGDEVKFHEIRDARDFADSWQVYAWQSCAFYRAPYDAEPKKGPDTDSERPKKKRKHPR